LLALRPEQNVRMHRVKRGDTLGGIAARYGSTVALLRKANGLHSNLLHISQVLQVPLQGPCTRCPVPPPVVVPERRLPPPHEVSETAAGVGSPEASAGAGTAQ
jgi:LysM repeat protein